MTRKSPSGTVYPARETAFDSIFGRASTLEKQPPFNMPEEVSEKGHRLPDRRCESFQHLHTNRVMKRQGLQKGMTMARKTDILPVAEYAAARYNLMKAILLLLLHWKHCTLCRRLNQTDHWVSEEGRVERDKKFSGKYLIAAHTFSYNSKGYI